MDIYVSKDGTGDFSSISEAFSVLPKDKEHARIFIGPGVYEERLNLKKDYVSLYGSKEGKTIITAGEYAFRDHEDGNKVGTFRTATFMADCDHFYAKNIVFENSAGQGKNVGQAIALYADGQYQVYEDCEMLGYQDTIFTAPLPEKEKQPGGFRGEKEHEPRRPGFVFFRNCRIEGNIDYIFGGAKAIFENCILFTRKREDEGVCYVTAASTPANQEKGYVFKSCKFLTDAPKGTVFLGRPWREGAKTVIMNCEMDEGINELGWDDWGKDHSLFYYAEWNNFGPGAGVNRQEYVKMLTDDDAKKY